MIKAVRTLYAKSRKHPTLTAGTTMSNARFRFVYVGEFTLFVVDGDPFLIDVWTVIGCDSFFNVVLQFKEVILTSSTK